MELFGEKKLCLERLKNYELAKINVFINFCHVDYLAGSRPLSLQTEEFKKMGGGRRLLFSGYLGDKL